jgi:hypothetical protein
MESIMFTVKFVLFLAMELFVIGTVGAALILAVYQAVRDSIRRRMAMPTGRARLPTRTGWH